MIRVMARYTMSSKHMKNSYNDIGRVVFFRKKTFSNELIVVKIESERTIRKSLFSSWRVLDSTDHEHPT